MRSDNYERHKKKHNKSQSEVPNFRKLPNKGEVPHLGIPQLYLVPHFEIYYINHPQTPKPSLKVIESEPEFYEWYDLEGNHGGWIECPIP
jgi:hypothetical protein